MLIIAIAVGVHDWNQEPVKYVICKDGSRENVTPETPFVCNNIPVHYDPETGSYEIAMYARNSIVRDAINQHIEDNFRKQFNLTNEKEK